MYPQRYGQTEIEVGDTVCDQYTGSCGRVVSIINNEVELEPTIIKRGARGEYLEVTEPSIRALKANLEPNHVRRYEELTLHSRTLPNPVGSLPHPEKGKVYPFGMIIGSAPHSTTHSPNPGRTSLKIDWFQKGVAAGKKDGWMDVENTVAETAAKHPEIKDPHELVWSDIDAWEETDHFRILYGSKMWDYARQAAEKLGLEDDPVFIATEYNDAKSEFWEGYLTGRREIGRDIYKIARGLV